MGRGVVQLSTYVDMVLGSLLAIGAVARLRYAQALYVLPISLFGMSIAAAELPDLARDRAQGTAALRERTIAAATRVAFFVVPSFVAFVLIGEIFVAGIYRAGQFGVADVRLVWLTLAAYSIGMLASTSGRIYQTAFFALRDTRTPARVAGLRVLTSAIAGGALMLQFEPVTLSGVTVPAGLFGDVRVAGLSLGPVGLALGAAVGAWLEWALLRGSLSRQIGSVGVGAGALGRLFGAAIAGAAGGYGLSLALHDLHPMITAGLVASVFGVIYLAMTRLLGVTEARVVMDGLLRRLLRRQH